MATSDNATNTISGTSMATPHVAGAAALILQATPTALAPAVSAAIINGSTPNKVTNAMTGSPNRLLYTNPGTTTTPPPPPPPPTGCGLAEAYTGSLSGTNAFRQMPTSSGYTVSRSGTHRGCLTGPSTADFDLALYKRKSSGS